MLVLSFWNFRNIPPSISFKTKYRIRVPCYLLDVEIVVVSFYYGTLKIEVSPNLALLRQLLV